jgi:hypothetical protein
LLLRRLPIDNANETLGALVNPRTVGEIWQRRIYSVVPVAGVYGDRRTPRRWRLWSRRTLRRRQIAAGAKDLNS